LADKCCAVFATLVLVLVLVLVLGMIDEVEGDTGGAQADAGQLLAGVPECPSTGL